MKRYIILLVAILGVVSCRKSDGDSAYKNMITLQPVVDASVNITTTRAKEYDIPTTVEDYSVVAVDKAGTQVYSSETMPSEIALARGTYSITLTSKPNADALFDTPMYQGSVTCESITDQKSALEVECKLNCTVVDVNYSENIAKHFASYKTTVWGNGTDKLVYTEASDERLGYFSITPTLNYRIEVVTTAGFAYSKTGTVEELKRGDLLKLDFDIVENPELETQPLVMELILNRSINEVEQVFEFGATLESTGVPVIVGRMVDLSQPIMVKYEVGSPVKLDIATNGKLSKILLMSDDNTNPLVADVVDPLVASTMGVQMMEGGKKGDLSTLLNIEEFTKKLPGSTSGSQISTITIGVLDLNGQYTTRSIIFNVFGVSVTTLDAVGHDKIDWFGERGQRNMVNATLKGQYNVETEPEGLNFMYRIKDGVWQSAEVEVDQATKGVSAKMSIPADGNVWEYKLESENETADTKEFTAPIYPLVSNMNLDAWPGGDLENPNGWGSPNYAGIFGIGRVTSTSRIEGWNGSGLGAQIKSGEAAGLFASGGLFTGTMEVNTSAPYKSAQVGIPFEGRPTKLTGYFKYTGHKIDKMDYATSPGNGAVSGGDDVCEIAIKLEKWDGGNYKIRWRDGLALGGFDETVGPVYGDSEYDGRPNGRNATEIRDKISVGFGQLVSTGEGDWVPFEIPIEYYKDVLPDHIIITAVSSAYGGYMCGAIGSTLYVDDLKFVY